MSDTAVQAIGALLTEVDQRIATLEARNAELETQLGEAINSARIASGELRLIQENLSAQEPRPAIEYLTSAVYVSRLTRNENIKAALSKNLGMRASRIGRTRGVLPIIVAYTTGSQGANAWPVSIWDQAYHEWETTQAH